mmetsp:Transcript_32685/g.54126  ORF Transcript_32685/g.54126 Transcript_32685/m.54126 type:complete len:147 (+) Transcript_32685:805-1245(+)
MLTISVKIPCSWKLSRKSIALWETSNMSSYSTFGVPAPKPKLNTSGLAPLGVAESEESKAAAAATAGPRAQDQGGQPLGALFDALSPGTGLFTQAALGDSMVPYPWKRAAPVTAVLQKVRGHLRQAERGADLRLRPLPPPLEHAEI